MLYFLSFLLFYPLFLRYLYSSYFCGMSVRRRFYVPDRGEGGEGGEEQLEPPRQSSLAGAVIRVEP